MYLAHILRFFLMVLIEIVLAFCLGDLMPIYGVPVGFERRLNVVMMKCILYFSMAVYFCAVVIIVTIILIRWILKSRDVLMQRYFSHLIPMVKFTA